jgi:hypothetical protein
MDGEHWFPLCFLYPLVSSGPCFPTFSHETPQDPFRPERPRLTPVRKVQLVPWFFPISFYVETRGLWLNPVPSKDYELYHYFSAWVPWAAYIETWLPVLQIYFWRPLWRIKGEKQGVGQDNFRHQWRIILDIGSLGRKTLQLHLSSKTQPGQWGDSKPKVTTRGTLLRQEFHLLVPPCCLL